jgi:hypothetical protein
MKRLFRGKSHRLVLSFGIFLLSFFFLPAKGAVGFLFQESGQSEKITLVKILKKTGEYCRKLSHAALYFVCLEEVTETIDISRDKVLKILFVKPTSPGHRRLLETTLKSPDKIVENTYVYDYQLIQKEDETEEQRILLKENGKKRHEENAELKTVMFRYEKVLFGPIDLLSRYKQMRHDYRVIGKEMFDGKDVLILEAKPKPSLQQRYFSGKVWIKRDDFSILKIEWNQKAIGNYQIIEDIGKAYKADPRITLISEYNIAKKGIRFPSRYFIEEAYITKSGKKFVRTEINVLYRDYKFFTVETEIKY